MPALRLTPLILAVALFMENMDSTVIATSLATIATDIGSEPIALKLALTAYLVSLAIFIPVSGWMADRFGARKVFQWAMLVFVLGSILCAISDSLLAFVASRFIQGMGGAMMSPLARLVLVRSTPRNKLVDAMAWLTIPAMVGPIIGPPFGGFLTTYFSWHWIFLINVPIGFAGIWLAATYLPPMAPRPVKPIDWTGFILAGIAFSGVVFGISVVSLPALPPVFGLAAIAAGIVSGAAYVFHARRCPHPLLDLRVLRFPLFRSSVVAGSFFRLGVGATPFLLPLLLQLIFGLTPFESGMVTFTGAMGALAAKFIARWSFLTFGFRALLISASFVSALLITVTGFYTPATPLWLIMGLLIAAGFAHSIFFTGVMAFSFSDIGEADEAQANVITAVSGQITFALGVALGGGILEASHVLRGSELVLADFQTAFFGVGTVAAVAVILFLKLPGDAGAHISGHRIAQAAKGSGESEGI
jgi:EmrB/QacA subfamily drug resistance transporter